MRTFYKIILLIIVLSTILIVINNQDPIEYSDGDTPVPPVPDRIKNTFKLYFIDNNKLVPEYRTIISDDLNFERDIVEELIKGPRNKILKQIIPKNTEILSIDTIDRISYVNFTEDFLHDEKLTKLEETLLIWSLVNSLTQLDYVDKVQILVEGNKPKLNYLDHSLNEPFKSNLELVKDEEITPFSVVKSFLDNIMTKRYDKAYNLLYNETKEKIDFHEFKQVISKYLANKRGHEILLYNTQKYRESIIVTIKYSLEESEVNAHGQEFDEDWKLVKENGKWRIVLDFDNIK